MRYLIVLLAAFGIILSAAALREHYNTETSPCSINDKWDCGVVNHSDYAVFHGIPVAAIGIVGYLLIGITGLLRQRKILLLLSFIALAFSLYLTHIEKDILGVWCIYCVGSLITIVLVTVFAIAWFAWSKSWGRTPSRNSRPL